MPIDWAAVEDDKSQAYDIMERYGYFGVALFTLLSGDQSFKWRPSKFIVCYVEYYNDLVKKLETNPGMFNKCIEFMEKLPSLFKIRELINKELITGKELIVMKSVLDIYEHYLISYDSPSYVNLKEYISTALLFYSSLSDEDVKYMYDTLEKNYKSSCDILSKLNL